MYDFAHVVASKWFSLLLQVAPRLCELFTLERSYLKQEACFFAIRFDLTLTLVIAFDTVIARSVQPRDQQIA